MDWKIIEDTREPDYVKKVVEIGPFNPYGRGEIGVSFLLDMDRGLFIKSSGCMPTEYDLYKIVGFTQDETQIDGISEAIVNEANAWMISECSRIETALANSHVGEK